MAQLKALILIKYDTDPEHYDNPDPREMVKLDITQDPAFIMTDSDWTIVSAELVNE